MEQPVHLLLSEQEAATFVRSRRRRRVVLTIAFTLGFVLAIVVLPPLVRHLNTVAGLTLAGAHIEWQLDNGRWLRGGVTHVSFADASDLVSDAALERLKGLNHVVALDLTDCDNVTAAGLALLDDLHDLKELELARSAHRRQPFLSSKIAHKLGDDALVPLRNMTQLTNLGLGGNLITDEGLARLSALTNLEMLDLHDTLVTDKGLKHLQGLKRLKMVILNGTKVTRKAASELSVAQGGTVEVVTDAPGAPAETPP